MFSISGQGSDPPKYENWQIRTICQFVMRFSDEKITLWDAG